MNVTDNKARLFEMIIGGKGLQYVMDACAELVGNPFVFANQSLQLVAKCTACADYPDVFQWIEDFGGEKLRVGQEASEAGYFRDIYAGDAPVYGRITGISSHWVAARVRLKTHILGNILMADCRTPFTEDYRELLPLVCQTIAFALQQPGKAEPNHQNYAPLLIELLAGNLTHIEDEQALRAQFQLMGKPLPKTIQVLVARSVETPTAIDPYILDAQLGSQFPSSLGVIYKNDYVRILDGKLSFDDIQERLLKYVHTPGIRFGLSWRCCSILRMRQAYLQADGAIRLCPGEKEGLLPFYTAVGPYLLEQAAQHSGIAPEGLLLPEVIELLRAKDGLQRLQDLAAYLSCGRNTTRAGELRGIHKNSMYYRLDRTMELTGLDLDDDDICVMLTLSLTLLGLLPFAPEVSVLNLCGQNKK